MQEDVKNYTFKEAIVRLYELLGNTSIDFEYEELPDKEVTVTIEDKEDD